MPDYQSDAEPPRAEPGKATVPESTDGQNQDGPRDHGGKTFQEHARDVMNRHADCSGSSLSRKDSAVNRERRDGKKTSRARWTKGTNPAAEAARTNNFGEKTLLLTLADIACRPYGDGINVNQALEDGWKQGVAHSMADGVMTQAEATRPGEIRDRLALPNSGADRKQTRVCGRKEGVLQLNLHCSIQPLRGGGSDFPHCQGRRN